MIADPELTRIVRSWLRTDEHESADHVLDNVFALLDATPQRRFPWPVRRIAQMNGFAKAAIAIAAVVVVAVVGFNLMPADSGVGTVPTPSPSPSPTAFPSPSPSPVPSPSAAALTWPSGSLEAASYDVALELCDTRGQRYGCNTNPTRFSFTPPSGNWSSKYDGVLETGTFPGSYAWIWFIGPIHAVGTDPCAGGSATVNPTVAEVANALTDITGTDAVEPIDTTVGGVPGKLVVLTVRDDIACPNADFWLMGDGSLYPNALGSTIKFRVLEVNGEPFVVYSDQAAPNPGLEQEIEQLVSSIQFG